MTETIADQRFNALAVGDLVVTDGTVGKPDGTVGVITKLYRDVYDNPYAMVSPSVDGKPFPAFVATLHTGQPMLVAILEGGLVQWEINIPGIGVVYFEVLDFDREEEDDDERLEWLEYAREVEAKVVARGADPDHVANLHRMIEAMVPGEVEA